MALAASMTFVACDKNESDLSAPAENSLKSVTLRLPNIKNAVKTRATGDAMAEGQIALNNFKVFFLDASGAEVTVPTNLGENLTQPELYFDGADVASHVGTGNATTYHLLPAATAKVVVVGNCGDVPYAELDQDTYTVLNDGDADVDADGNEHPYYPLYGESGLTPKNGADDVQHNNVYTATVNLEPRIARFEIFGFGYADATAEAFESVELNKIALSNYYTNYNLVSGAAKGTVVNCPTESTAIWDWIQTTATAPWANVFAANFTIANNTRKFANGTTMEATYDIETQKGNGVENIITFGVMPAATAANNPELMLSFYGVKGADKTPLYLRGTFNNSKEFEAGKIYRVFFPIQNWDQPERCVELTVTVMDWSVEVITPDVQ